ELAVDHLNRGTHPRINRKKEAIDRHQQRSGVKVVTAKGLRIDLLDLTPATNEDRIANTVTLNNPVLDVRVLAQRRHELHNPIQNRPAQHLKKQMITGNATHLPDTQIDLLPAHGDNISKISGERLDLQM